ncbi:AzlD domain-containing protein [Marinibacterium profundimaris]|uniref:Membrane protein n=1 Tax=Marinibacterium profundimaris TaxID=1679460 RepID=A0A225NHS8_9RHOB|nr:AzlD domain-containing protein [Marinibacterium profundimaris]OWU73376.1 membrane protein [Marinibacterium profundimaris]
MTPEQHFSDAVLWTVIIGLALGSFGLRFLFLGFVGDRPLPRWMLRLLRYTAVTILPALVTPLVIWPQSNDGQTDPVKLCAALATLAVGYLTRSVLPAVFAGAAVLLLPALLA